MKKMIKKYGNTLVISFFKEEVQMYDLHEHDVVDVEICKLKEKKL